MRWQTGGLLGVGCFFLLSQISFLTWELNTLHSSLIFGARLGLMGKNGAPSARGRASPFTWSLTARNGRSFSSSRDPLLCGGHCPPSSDDQLSPRQGSVLIANGIPPPGHWVISLEPRVILAPSLSPPFMLCCLRLLLSCLQRG